MDCNGRFASDNSICLERTDASSSPSRATEAEQLPKKPWSAVLRMSESMTKIAARNRVPVASLAKPFSMPEEAINYSLSTIKINLAIFCHTCLVRCRVDKMTWNLSLQLSIVEKTTNMFIYSYLTVKQRTRGCKGHCLCSDVVLRSRWAHDE